MTTILAIETSCDDTSAAVIVNGEVKSSIVFSQEDHAALGGVVPELASRQHQIKIIPVVEKALSDAKVSKSELSAIAFTKGPGLLGSLLVGVSFAKSMALALNIPLIEVHHMHAHILAHFADEPKPSFPFLCLTVSGGHTQIVMVENYNSMKILGSTIDDAAGEAFDKVGKMLSLPYPAGPHIDKLAQLGNPVFKFALPFVDNLNYSFSGFKTSVLYFLRDKMKENPNFIVENLNDLCASVQHSIIQILMKKVELAVLQTGISSIAIAGGVAANSGLRNALNDKSHQDQWQVFIPAMKYCTDNAGMIGIAAYYKYQDGIFCDQSVVPEPRMLF